jgi:hypothetical protein
MTKKLTSRVVIFAGPQCAGRSILVTCPPPTTMAQSAKASHSRLRPSPKAQEKAIKGSAAHAQRMAAAFGLKVPGIAEKPSSKPRKAVAPRSKVRSVA